MPWRSCVCVQEAWSVANEVLVHATTSATDEPVAFFAANVLLAKMRFDFAILPPESHKQLQAAVLSHIKKFAPAPGMHRTATFSRLCLVVAVMAVQINWQDVVAEVVHLVSTPGSLPSLLEILMLLPEEVCFLPLHFLYALVPLLVSCL